MFSSLALGTLPILSVLCSSLSASQSPFSIQASITADNDYGLGFGNAYGLATYSGRANTDNSFYTSESFTHPSARPGEFIYLITWSDSTNYDINSPVNKQMVLGQFTVFYGSVPLRNFYTGVGSWQVFATGIDYDSYSPGPSVAEINQQIAIANAGSGAPNLTSVGWVQTVPIVGREGVLVNGELNVADANYGTCYNLYSVLCYPQIGSAARLMWYASPSTSCAFEGGTDHREFLIFRRRLKQEFLLPSPPPPLAPVEVPGG